MERDSSPHTLTAGVAAGTTRVVRQRLSDGSTKTYQYTTVKKHIELTFKTNSEKVQFEKKCEDIRIALGCKSLKDVLVKVIMNFSTCSTTTPHAQQPLNMPSTVDQVDGSSTLQTGQDDGTNNKALDAIHENFVGQCSSIVTLIDAVSSHCCTCVEPYSVQSWMHTGHVLSVEMKCLRKHSLKWSSSSTIVPDTKEFNVNHRMMLSYLASGMTSIQFERFSNFSRFGQLSDHFRKTSVGKFSAICENLRKQSVYGARAEESSLSTNGAISIMTDARHHCRKNSYHTDHIAIGLRTHKVLDIQHINREDDICTQRHEAVGFDRMYQNLDESNLEVAVHVHDRNMTINKRLRDR